MVVGIEVAVAEVALVENTCLLNIRLLNWKQMGGRIRFTRTRAFTDE